MRARCHHRGAFDSTPLTVAPPVPRDLLADLAKHEFANYVIQRIYAAIPPERQRAMADMLAPHSKDLMASSGARRLMMVRARVQRDGWDVPHADIRA